MNRSIASATSSRDVCSPDRAGGPARTDRLGFGSIYRSVIHGYDFVEHGD